MGKKKISDEIKAKHVFGELTLGEVLSLINRIDSITFVDKDGNETDYVNFNIQDERWEQEDRVLDLWDSFDDESPAESFPLDTKVKVVDEDHMELEDGREIHLMKMVPIPIKILDVQKSPSRKKKTV